MKKIMKKMRLILFLPVLANIFWGLPGAQDDIEKNPSCRLCGMDREKFNYSRVLIEYNDGSITATCSINCAALDMTDRNDMSPKVFQVADYDTQELIDGRKAFWIIGGGKKGVMTQRAKWAFAEKEGAERFKKENGGELASFDEAIKAAFEDSAQHSHMLREEMKR